LDTDSDPFASIRPYRDDEVVPVLARLLDDPEFIGAITALRFGAWAKPLRWPLQPLVRRVLRHQVRDVCDVSSMQLLIRGYLERMIRHTTAGFTVSGLERLPRELSCLYISNHRDITLDPAFTNYALHRDGRKTVRIAIGDNLLTKPYISDLMRLNKSFIVKRSMRGPRQVLAAYRLLSQYIYHSIHVEEAPIWIAQREGRAKDGRDETEPAIIKMLAMSQDKTVCRFGEHIASLNIVPVAISYELDPCDGMKAAELVARAAHGGYLKAADEDVRSIANGISGSKGHVHVSFGAPLGAGFDSADAVAEALDARIIADYRLHATNLYAYRRLHGATAPLPADAALLGPSSCAEADFHARIDALPAAHRDCALAIYANAVVSKLEREQMPAVPRAD